MGRKKLNYRFHDEVKKIFGTSFSDYFEDEKQKFVHFRVDYGFTTEKLFALSDLLGTATINTSPEYEEYGGCPTCGNDITAYISISATGVKF